MKRVPEFPSSKLCGIPLSPGIIVGTAYHVEPFTPSFYRLRISRVEVDQELRRFEEAVAQSRRQLTSIKQRLEAQIGRERSYIADVQLLILEDKRFRTEIEERIVRQLCSPERAIREAAEEWLSSFRSLQDPFFQERGSELKDVEERLLANLTEVNGKNGHLPEALILVAPEVTLSVLADYQLERIKGLVVTKAGAASHVTIIARSYQIPMVSGIENLTDQVHTGDTILVDGCEGVVYRNPSRRETRRYQSCVEKKQQTAATEDADTGPFTTIDGRAIHLYLNTETESEVDSGLRQGAEGVGLFRSEFMFVKNTATNLRASDRRSRAAGTNALLTEQTQFDVYRGLALAAGGKPVVLRTLDTGEAGLISSLQAGADKTSFGLRGIRLSLKHPDIFRLQLRAALRASLFGKLKIVFPMVASVDEVIKGRQAVDEVQAELQREGIELTHPIRVGVMLEVPAAILTLDNILCHADFAAVGTNDLIQYTLAAGRADDVMADLFNPLHPAVLMSLKKVAETSRRVEKLAYICGELASHPLYAYILIGLGFQHLSLHLGGLASLKRVIRAINYGEARDHVNQLLELPTVEAVNRFVEDHLAAWRTWEKQGADVQASFLLDS
ncbi:MAG: phosphoenolpyruvate--protein phosphotransferase [Acidobacteria bacterium]|nr:MAG: phosphoenolpyruvate--protein phosphotransferase [Acidobacteriota bacterium]